MMIESPSKPPFFNNSEQHCVWPIERERSLIFGRAYRLLLEVVHPEVADVINNTATFTFDRLRRTMSANNEIIFGTYAEAISRASIVNRAHQSTGANVSELKLFVFDMRVFGTLQTYEAFIDKLTDVQKDDYVNVIKKYGFLLGVPMGKVAVSYTELISRVQSHIKKFNGIDTSNARMISSKLLRPFYKSNDASEQLFNSKKLVSKIAYRTLRPFANEMNCIVTKGLMCGEVRDFYELTWNKQEAEAFNVFSDIIKIIVNKTPISLRYNSEYMKWRNSYL